MKPIRTMPGGLSDCPVRTLQLQSHEVSRPMSHLHGKDWFLQPMPSVDSCFPAGLAILLQLNRRDFEVDDFGLSVNDFEGNGSGFNFPLPQQICRIFDLFIAKTIFADTNSHHW